MVEERLNMDEVYDELRRAVMEELRLSLGRQKQDDLHVPVQNARPLEKLLPNRQLSVRDREKVGPLLFQIYHELHLERIIVPGSGNLDSANAVDWPWYRVTEHGRRILATRDYSPYDPSGYLRRLSEEIPGVDETIVRYLAESLHCLRTDCLLAAAVTVGCASEKAMLLVVEKFGEAIADPVSRTKYEKATSDWKITVKYTAFRKWLATTKNLPGELQKPLESHLDGTFNLIRHVRNEAGHPSGEPVRRDTIIANQTIFPGYCKYVYSLMDHFAKEGVGF